jgi:uncharacterized protein YcnI
MSIRTAALTALVVVSMAVALGAHVTVAPQQSKAGATQDYNVRVHNENSKHLATNLVELPVPEGVTIVKVGKPPSGTFSTKEEGGRITLVTWTVEIPADKYVELPFTARNPAGPRDVTWKVRQHLTDGSILDWSDAPGAAGKPSITKILNP